MENLALISQRECTFQSHQLEDSNLGKGTAKSGTQQTRNIIITSSCIRSDTEEEYLVLHKERSEVQPVW